MSRLMLQRKGVVRAAAISAAGLLGAMSTSAFGATGLTISLQSKPGLAGAAGGTIFAAPTVGVDPAIPVTVYVYATVTGTGAPAAADLAGLQYAYYNVNSIGTSANPTTLGGAFTAATPNSDPSSNFNGGLELGNGSPAGLTGNGVQAGALTNATPAGAGQPGIAVGSTAATLIAKPRAANIVWGPSTSTNTTDVYTSGNSTSFLVETLTYAAGSTISTIAAPVQSNLTTSIPTVGGGLVGANWFEDSTSTSSPTGFNNGTYGTGSAVTVTSALAGDANLDGNVGTSDFNILVNNFGKPGGWTQGDWNGDGNVGTADFNLLVNNFGKGLTAGPLDASAGPLDGDAAELEAFAVKIDDVAGFEAASGLTIPASLVPEPTTLSLLAIGGISLLGRRRRASV